MKKLLDRLARTVDRAITDTLGKQLLLFLSLAVVIFVLLFAVRMLLFPHQPGSPFGQRFWNTVHNYIGTGAFDNLGRYERWLILLTNISSTVIFAGVLVALFTNSIYQRIGKVKNGEVHYSFGNHTIIIGYEHICNELVRRLSEQGEVVLQTSHDVKTVRRELFYGLDDRQRNKVTIVSGNRVLRQDVGKLNVHRCREIFLFGGIKEDAHDSKSVECLGIINEIASKAGRKIRCHVLFEHHSTFAVFQ
ncbi:MAG: hypothetical protein FWD88_08310 [Treponema sp.]|nr:hypothetical protein [Treponema sp.]